MNVKDVERIDVQRLDKETERRKDNPDVDEKIRIVVHLEKVGGKAGSILIWIRIRSSSWQL
jgi:hypothetical protein